MNCVSCKYNDGMVYTSIPPKYKCTITNEFHLAFDDCNVKFAPVKHGRWIGVEYDGYADGNPVYDVWECSECHGEHYGEYDTLPPYCKDCGAMMDEEVQE